jgi:hypothetical protein
VKKGNTIFNSINKTKEALTMKRGTVGFGAGVVAGLIKLLIDQITYATNISNVNTAGTVSQILYGTEDKLPLISWGIYIVLTGLVGFILLKIISKETANNFIFTGIITGVVIWAAMNFIFMATRISNTTWSMGVGSLVMNLISHIVFGIVVIYFISKSKEVASE